jgi:hypothetical protein
VLSIESAEDRVLGELERLADLSHNWDAEGGRPPRRETIDLASVFVVQLGEAARRLGINVPEPKVVAAGDGSVGLVWRHATAPWTFEVEVGENGIGYVDSVFGVVQEGTLESPEEALPLLPQ